MLFGMIYVSNRDGNSRARTQRFLELLISALWFRAIPFNLDISLNSFATNAFRNLFSEKEMNFVSNLESVLIIEA